MQRIADAGWIVLVHVGFYALYGGRAWTDHDTVATGGAALLFLFAAEAAGLYQAWRGVPLRKELFRVFLSWTFVVTVLLFGAFVLKESETFSRLVTVSWFLAAPVVVSTWRSVVRLALQEMRKRGRNTRRVAIAGMTEMGERVAKSIQESPWLGMQLLGFFDDRTPERCHELESEFGDCIGGFDDLVKWARDGDIDLIYVALPLKAEPRVNAILRKLADTTASVYMVPDFFVFDLLHGRWSQLDDIPVVSVFETPFYGVSGWVKRFEDIVLGSLFLAIASVPMLLVAIGIKLTSRGPIFFQQRRYGLNGEVIPVLKFRTMTVAEDGGAVTQAKKNDSRITPFGAFLRRMSLDELPQLLHVVTGSMSLVGPRPHAVAHNEEYRQRIHGYMLRHKVKPGLTGWAQVNGWRGETDTLHKMEMRVEHDLEYIRRWGLLFDLKIIFLTVFGSKVRQNAY
ncbi:MAG: undecaprenyl-phosphate glucose phosphotransferase [Sandaracinaceae bacterium]|nr:undecaprenyl-phosphate glucose phosphotransferase [Sandaracinaceae bacterium]